MWCQGKQKIGRHTDLLVWSNWPHGVQWFVFSCSPEQSPTGAEAGVPVPSTLLFTLMVSRCWRQGQWNLWDAAKEWKRPKKTLRIFFHFIFKETVLLFTKITFICNSSPLSNTHARTSFPFCPLCFSVFLYVNSSVMQPTKWEQCRLFFSPLASLAHLAVTQWMCKNGQKTPARTSEQAHHQESVSSDGKASEGCEFKFALAWL